MYCSWFSVYLGSPFLVHTTPSYNQNTPKLFDVNKDSLRGGREHTHIRLLTHLLLREIQHVATVYTVLCKS